MAAKIEQSELNQAEKEYCERHSIPNMEVPVSLKDGAIVCADKTIKEALQEIIMDLRTPAKAMVASNSRKITGRSQAGSQQGSALDEVRACQATEKTSYSTGKGKSAASAKTNIAALMQAGGSLEILSLRQDMDFVEYKVRATLGNQHVDSSMTIHQKQYLAKKAWDWVPKYMMDDPGIVVGTDENLMPIFREGATISIRISDEGRSIPVPFPAQIAMFKEMAREWQSAGRVCETKAYSRAADMILRSDFQSREELAEEQSEVDWISEKQKGA
jgi:hypothetical protein